MKIKKRDLYERLMIFFAAVVQVIGFVISITTEDFSKSFLPHFDIIIPIVNISCALICFFLVIFPNFRFLQSLVLFIQGLAMTLNDKLFLGLFLYFLGVAFLFCYGYLNTKKTAKILSCLVPLFLSFFVILAKDFQKFCMAWAYSLFITFVEFHIYSTIKSSVVELFPLSAKAFSSVTLPEHGEKLDLAKYDFTERQINILTKFSEGIRTYKELANVVITSESTIKHEMIEICKKMGVENTTYLALLLQQYRILQK